MTTLDDLFLGTVVVCAREGHHATEIVAFYRNGQWHDANIVVPTSIFQRKFDNETYYLPDRPIRKNGLSYYTALHESDCFINFRKLATDAVNCHKSAKIVPQLADVLSNNPGVVFLRLQILFNGERRFLKKLTHITAADGARFDSPDWVRSERTRVEIDHLDTPLYPDDFDLTLRTFGYMATAPVHDVNSDEKYMYVITIMPGVNDDQSLLKQTDCQTYLEERDKSVLYCLLSLDGAARANRLDALLPTAA